ncbi:hypothetical protein pETSU_244 [Edwardsiella phage pEt-SU]|uniref:Uncharacterized protein n=1 Tax=Edwardsiella phage pEt-SU TaxID=2562142 RepID=A0A4D6DWZ1_9CAUD|nr:hypothetical protein HOV39_gp278 [Edwardsiella phage pEt-SU]QBZ70825.1 hypothetical protein pETSU_244 [Edwardsiella phage pEt-SU]
MNPYIASIPMILLIVLIVSHTTWKMIKRRREIDKLSKETIQGIRLSLVSYLNKEFASTGEINEVKLYTKCRDIQDMYTGIVITTLMPKEFLTIDIVYGKHKSTITCHRRVPKWHRENNTKYEVV